MKNEETDEKIDDLARLLYRTANRRTSWDADLVGLEVGAEPARVERAVARLIDLGLLVPKPAAPSEYTVSRPEETVARLLMSEERIFAEGMRARERVRTLMRSFPMEGQTGGGAPIELRLSGAEVNAFIEARTAAVRRRQLVMHPGGAPPPELIGEMATRDIEVISRGVRIRALYPRHIASIGYVGDYLARAADRGADVRVASYLPIRMILLDEDLAVLPIDPENTSMGAFAIRSAEVVKSLEAIFDFHWQGAARLDQLLERTGQGSSLSLSTQEVAIVRMLAMGVKDDAIARQLSFSPRTLSRAIASLQERLGVRSRFQAAVHLTRAGLLDAC